MKQQLRDAWVAALRSGKYAQGRGQLRRRENEFCCLGVLCDLTNPKQWSSNGDTKLKFGPKFYVPVAVQKKTRIPYDVQAALVRLNDAERKPFSEIADYIEANVPVEA